MVLCQWRTTGNKLHQQLLCVRVRRMSLIWPAYFRRSYSFFFSNFGLADMVVLQHQQRQLRRSGMEFPKKYRGSKLVRQMRFSLRGLHYLLLLLFQVSCEQPPSNALVPRYQSNARVFSMHLPNPSASICNRFSRRQDLGIDGFKRCCIFHGGWGTPAGIRPSS